MITHNEMIEILKSHRDGRAIQCKSRSGPDDWYDYRPGGEPPKNWYDTDYRIKPPKPIEPPAGYRLLEDEEVVAQGDLYRCISRVWGEADSTVGRTVLANQAVFSERAYFARKIEPRYRPFASAAEFSPHRDKWIRWKNGDEHLFRVGAFHNSVVWPACASVGTDYAKSFREWLFEDGSPFGVLEN